MVVRDPEEHIGVVSEVWVQSPRPSRTTSVPDLFLGGLVTVPVGPGWSRSSPVSVYEE